MWQLTMHCHLRAPDAIPVLTLKFYAAWGHQRPNFDGFIYVEFAVPFSRLASAPFTSLCLVKFEFRLLTSVCDAWQWGKMQNLRRGMGKTSVLF